MHCYLILQRPSIPYATGDYSLNFITFGKRGFFLQWIEAFKNREQMVVVEFASSWLQMSSSVPQGSILGPLFFLVFVNDIANNLRCETRLFADDCVIYRKS